MRITHINLARGFRGGERQTALLIQYLSKQSIPQYLVCRTDSPLRQYLMDTPGLSFIPANHYVHGHFKHRQAADLCHAHEAKGAYWAYIRRIFKKTPYVITRRVLNPLSRNPLTRSVYRQAHAVVALSSAVKAQIEAYDPVLDQIRIIPSAKSDLPFDPGNVAELKKQYQGKFVIGHIGALVNKDKGQRYVIEAARDLMNKIPELYFIFLGEGKDKPIFQAAAEGLSNIEFAGFKGNVGDYLAVMNILMLPSLKEGLGSIILDAMDYRVPVIASTVGGIPDMITHGENGWLVPPANSRAIAEAIEILYADMEKRRAMAEAGFQTARRYSADHIGASYLNLYKEITG
ncbi:MAG: glycosyltransferase family 4 protein [Desulfobacterales bacterium]|nr:glycosyltransferase family 4 protein [Desulfobacterales bacterium]